MDYADLGPAMAQSGIEQRAKSAEEKVDRLERRVDQLERELARLAKAVFPVSR